MITEILPSVYRLESLLGGRLLYQYLLVGERPVLVDTGVSDTPHAVILPALARLGIAPERLALVLVTHCDLDHQGGNAAIKAACPRALLSCGRADAPLVADPQALLARRYDAYRERHGIFYSPEGHAGILAQAGAAQPLDLTWVGGETFAVDSGWELEIMHVPGHSRGHLAIYDRRNRALYTGDAVHGALYPGAADGLPKLPPTYLDVADYLATIDALGRVDAELLAGDHWPVKRGPEVRAFLEESRRFVEQADVAILEELGGGPRTLRELIARCGPRLGGWPDAVNIELVFAFNGHVERLEALGLVARVGGAAPAQYALAA
jgi:glyoxylase-like metal-dependent hydrolase (beta-lactamase superfamily II)